MLVALTVAQRLGLLGVAAVFIAFALASAFLFPRARPDFPGTRRVRWFVALSIALMIAMLSAIAVLAREGDEGEAHAQASPTETQLPGQSETEPTRDEESRGGETHEGEQAQGETQEGGQAQGDAAAGEAVFTSAGCGGCHVLADAGSTGNVGPSLDESKPSYELAVDRVTNGSGAMPAFRQQLSEEQIRNVAAYVVQATGR